MNDKNLNNNVDETKANDTTSEPTSTSETEVIQEVTNTSDNLGSEASFEGVQSSSTNNGNKKTNGKALLIALFGIGAAILIVVLIVVLLTKSVKSSDRIENFNKNLEKSENLYLEVVSDDTNFEIQLYGDENFYFVGDIYGSEVASGCYDGEGFVKFGSSSFKGDTACEEDMSSMLDDLKVQLVDLFDESKKLAKKDGKDVVVKIDAEAMDLTLFEDNTLLEDFISDEWDKNIEMTIIFSNNKSVKFEMEFADENTFSLIVKTSVEIEKQVLKDLLDEAEEVDFDDFYSDLDDDDYDLELDEKTDDEADSNEEDTSSSTEKYNIGDTVTVDLKEGSYKFTITGVSETDYRDEYSDVDADRVIIIDYEYESIDYDDLWITEYDVSVYDENGTACDDYYAPVTNAKKISAGRNTSGQMAFAITEGKNYAELELEGDYSSGIVATYVLEW